MVIVHCQKPTRARLGCHLITRCGKPWGCSSEYELMEVAITISMLRGSKGFQWIRAEMNENSFRLLENNFSRKMESLGNFKRTFADPKTNLLRSYWDARRCKKMSSRSDKRLIIRKVKYLFFSFAARTLAFEFVVPLDWVQARFEVTRKWSFMEEEDRIRTAER